MFEHSVAKMEADGSNSNGRFLQVSGFRLVYDPSRSVGSRVAEVDVVGENGYSGLEDDKNYDVVIPNYLIGGGDGYTIGENMAGHLQGPLDLDVMKEFLHENSPVSAELEGRIRVVTGGGVSGGSVPKMAGTTLGLLLSYSIYFSIISCGR